VKDGLQQCEITLVDRMALPIQGRKTDQGEEMLVSVMGMETCPVVIVVTKKGHAVSQKIRLAISYTRSRKLAYKKAGLEVQMYGLHNQHPYSRCYCWSIRHGFQKIWKVKNRK